MPWASSSQRPCHWTIQIVTSFWPLHRKLDNTINYIAVRTWNMHESVKLAIICRHGWNLILVQCFLQAKRKHQHKQYTSRCIKTLLTTTSSSSQTSRSGSALSWVLPRFASPLPASSASLATESAAPLTGFAAGRFTSTLAQHYCLHILSSELHKLLLQVLLGFYA